MIGLLWRGPSAPKPSSTGNIGSRTGGRVMRWLGAHPDQGALRRDATQVHRSAAAQPQPHPLRALGMGAGAQCTAAAIGLPRWRQLHGVQGPRSTPCARAPVHTSESIGARAPPKHQIYGDEIVSVGRSTRIRPSYYWSAAHRYRYPSVPWHEVQKQSAAVAEYGAQGPRSENQSRASSAPTKRAARSKSARAGRTAA